MRGGEKVLENICDLYPDADIFTHVYNPICISDKINSHNVYTTFINRLPFVKKYYQYYLPLMPIALKKINLNKYDLIISCESGPSKGINKYNAKHICYCHTPMRYLWDMHDIYYENYNVIAKLGMKIFIKYLRKWDLESSFNIDRIITNSKFVSNRIAKYWNKESFVVYPGIDTSKCKKDNIDNNYYLIISEIVSYKRIDLAIEAFANLNHKLIIIGDGPLLNKYKKKCSSNIEMLGWKEDYEKDIYLSNCSALIFPGIEDFGLVPLEAMVFGKPVIAYIAGLTAPKGRVMGHAGAIVSAYGESAVEKVELLKECGVSISKNPSVMGETVKKVLRGEIRK